MRFNNGLERKRFENNWDRLRIEYRQAGMDEKAIEAMYEFDLEQYRSRRRYMEHSQELDKLVTSDECSFEDGKSELLKKFLESLSVSARDTDELRAMSWINEIEDEKITLNLKNLNKLDLELLTLYVFYGYSQSESGEILGITQAAISKRMRKIKVIFSNL